MRCAKAEQLLYLMRPGELDDATRGKLARHLAGCPRCSGIRTRMSAAQKDLDPLLHSQPVNPDAAALTSAIMERIQQENVARGRIRVWAIPAGLPLQRIRVVSYAAAWIIAGAFFLMSYQDARRLGALESRLAQAAANSGSAYVLSPDQLSTAERMVPRLNHMNPAQSQAALFDFASAASILQSSSLGSTPELERLRAKYPRLWSLTLDHGLDDSTRTILATEGRAFLKDVQDLVNLGER